MARLSGVFCTSTHACEVVGHFENSSRVIETLAEVWSGSKWAFETTPAP